jgi:hypothetical protein
MTEKSAQAGRVRGAGLAADNVTNPLTHATFGAEHGLTPIGKAVQKTGTLKGLSGGHTIQGSHSVASARLNGVSQADDIVHSTIV